jgi:Lar family restriction alleviation protein
MKSRQCYFCPNGSCSSYCDKCNSIKAGGTWQPPVIVNDFRLEVKSIDTEISKENNKLSPCPFCGSHKLETRDDDEYGAGWYIYCRHCYARGSIVDTEQEAINAWNKRNKE